MVEREYKIQKVYDFNALGFKVRLHNVRFYRFGNDWVFDRNVFEIGEVMARVVPLKPAPLTGAELKFLRKQHKMTQDELAKVLEATRQSVINWEKTKQEPAGLATANERLARIFFLRKAGVKGTMLEKGIDLILQPRRKSARAGYQIAADQKPAEVLKQYIEKQAA
jgi:DNA-binding XRE family transcriptional regulator